MSGKRAGRRTRRRSAAPPPVFRGWLSTDEQEIERRQWRGRTEISEVRAIDEDRSPFCDYEVTSSSGTAYRVEIRAIGERVNSCGCRDHQTNRLGTCKHVEGVLRRLRRVGSGKLSGRIEVFLDERDERAPRLSVPDGIAESDPGLAARVEGLFGGLRQGSGDALAELHRLARENPDAMRVSHRLEMWAESLRSKNERRLERARFEADLEAGRRSMDILKLPLLPYQTEGALHLAFGGRALLADDMGLGKTVQAIAACALLRELRGIERVLVVSPASLKAEWQEQIARFSDLSATVVYGNLPARRAAYADDSFFTLCNYEQVVADGREMIDAVAPDVVILDEAQRIKNWQTKTANAVKKMESRYAFVLTGTPIENRIDELYSIVQFLDPELLGPLFRFNREYYVLDDGGRPTGFRNLEGLSDRVSGVMLRRRKDDVETQLPGLTEKTFFVPMTEAQTRVYEDYEYLARRLAAIAARRPLTAEEFEMLQRHLGCMRMVCDTLHILGAKQDGCPKMDEIEKLVPDLLDDPECKIVVFSEWVRMLELVRAFAVEAGIEFAWHTGSVPQVRRRAEIRRFREDPACRLFLSSDSGSVGLNLQVADTVINMDQPWNPARLDQRIARAWRKHQKRTVRVFNLVSEGTIEHRMLGLLDAKRTLAEGVLDRRGDLAAIPLPTGRPAFMERLNAVLGADEAGTEPGTVAASVSPLDALRDRLIADHSAALRRLFGHEEGSAALAVIDLPPERIAVEEERLAGLSDLTVTVIDPATHDTMLRLAESGLVTLPTDTMIAVYPMPEEPDGEDGNAGLLRARALAERAEHKLRAARLLVGGGFDEEACAPAVDAIRMAAGCLAAAAAENEPGDAEEAAAFLAEREPAGEVDGVALDAVRVLSGEAGKADPVGIAEAFLDHVSKQIGET
ncbi:MAG: DEAD/DEAH box helicase [Defluviicoccus sp.]|nr:DEAD/DEAH box helicase [Defluviicoccus sp.]MDE0279144.1 DEAD/DEAH box helicase [Defluviicoccus sp.]